MGGNSGAGAQGQGQAADQQLIQEAISAWGWAFPMLQRIAPELLGTMQGKYTPLIGAARAPVIGQTQQDIRTLQNQAGGVSNPNALYQDMAMSGQQQAGLAGDQMISQAMNALTNLISGSMSFSGSGLSSGAGQLNQLGLGQEQLYNQQQDTFWSGLLGGIGGLAGMFNKGAAGAGGMPAYGPNPATSSTDTTFSTPGAAAAALPAAPFAALGAGVPGFTSPGYSWSGVPSGMTTSGASAPASSSSNMSNSTGLPPWLQGAAGYPGP